MSLANEPLFSDPVTKQRVMQAVSDDLARRGYGTDYLFIDTEAAGRFRVYSAVIKLPRDEFLGRYAPEALESMSPTTETALKQYRVDPDKVVGWDRTESRPITAREIMCLE